MDGPHLNIAVTTSFDQCLALIVIFSICCLSLVAWPDFYHFGVFLCFCFILEFFVVFFGYQFFKLKSWQCRFSLNQVGEGRLFFPLEHNGTTRDTDNRFQSFVIAKDTTSWVTPLAVLFYIDLDVMASNKRERRVLLIWADMLNEEKYRHLCRILIKHKS